MYNVVHGGTNAENYDGFKALTCAIVEMGVRDYRKKGGLPAHEIEGLNNWISLLDLDMTFEDIIAKLERMDRDGETVQCD